MPAWGQRLPALGTGRRCCHNRGYRPLPRCSHRTRTLGTSYLVERPVIVFEVISPGNSAIDRITKVREYLAVASIHTYVIVEQSSIGLTVLRRHDDNSWITTTLTAEDVLRLHEPEVEIPVPELYENVDLPDAEISNTAP